MNRALHLGLTGGNSSIQAKLTNGTTNKLLIQPSGSATEFGGDVSGSATSTGSFGHLVIGSDSTTFKNLSIDQLTTKAAITVDESAGTSNSAVLNLLADRPSDGQDAAEIRMRNNSATSFARIVGVRGSADTYGDLHFRTRNASGLTTRLAIDQDGNVGIGHTAPTELLHVKKSTGDVNLVVESVAAGTTPTLHIKSPADRAGVIKFSEGGALKTSIFHGTDDSLNFYLNSGNDATLQLNSDKSIRMYGNVGIGMAPTHNFNLRSTGNVEFRIQSTDDDARLQISSDNDEGQDSILEFLSNTSTRGSILYDHNTTAASQKMDFKVGDNAVTAMTILGDGKVGIGATSIGYKLDVEEGSGNEIARFQGANSGNIVFRNSTSNEFVMYTGPSDALIFGTGGNNERVRIDASGNVGIGTTSPSVALDVTGQINASTNVVAGTALYSNELITRTGNTLTVKTAGGSAITTFMNTGNVGIGTASPSAKLHVDGDAIVTGKITAQEFHTEFVSASITFESGSTKFGDTNDDLHQFTGSMRIQKSDDVNLKLMRGSQNVAYLGDLGSQNDGGLILYDESGNQDILIRTKDATNNFINTTGNFGFGTTVPGNKVHIQETNTDDYSAGGDNYANAILRLHNADTSATTPHALIHFRLDKNGGDGYLGFTTDGSTGNVEHFVLGNQTDNEILRVASGGNVGIGTTSLVISWMSLVLVIL